MVLPASIVPANEVALIDAAAEAMGLDIAELMERAGTALATEAESMAPEGPILIATGPGNNGGDGLVAARVLADRGRTVWLWMLREPSSPLAQAQAQRLPAAVIRLEAAPEQPPVLIIDAILGAGTSGPLRAWASQATAALRAIAAPVLAADCPTGIGGPDLLPSQRCLCFQVAKSELIDDPRVGEFKSVDIGIPPAAWQELQPALMHRFPRHLPDGHKGQHGELMVVGGGMFPGALHFACRAGVISGCDLVRAWTAGDAWLPPSVIANRQEGRWLAPTMPERLTPMLVRASAILIGPGLGREAGTPEATRQVFSLAQELEVPAVIDADGITHLAAELRDLPADAPPVILTPHGGEARTLLGHQADEEHLHRFARSNRIILKKGRVDLITDGRRWQHNHRGNPRMAVGGTGDCLAGLAAGLLARGCDPFDAARLATLWWTTTCDHLWQRQGPCWTPDQALDALPDSLRDFLEPMGAWPPMEQRPPA